MISKDQISEANEEEERILREKSEVKSPTFDTTPCLHSSIDDLDLDLFRTEYLPKSVKTSVLKNDKRRVKQQLASLQLFDSVHDCPTIAGILLIGKDPKHILFGSYIQYVQFAGKNRASKILNERQFSGNLLTMLKELDYFIKYTIQKQRPVFVTVLREEMRINYPYEAIRELAMNLVMHRNYQTNAPAKFYEYSDRIEMDNPGNLYGKVHPDNFPNENDYRNPVIAVAMKTLGYVNQFGRGIEMVQDELDANKNGLAVFQFDDITTFKVIVMNADLESVGDTSEIHRKNIREDNEAINEAESDAINEAENEAINEAESDAINEAESDAINEAESDAINEAESDAINEAENEAINEAESDAINEAENEAINEAESDAIKISSRQVKILQLIREDNSLTRETISKNLKVSNSSVYRDIENLKKIGKLERIGGNKGGYWKL